MDAPKSWMANMDHIKDSPNVRKGRFLWMDDSSKKSYLESLNQKIATRYFFSDAILSKVVEDLTPLFGESAVSDLA